VLVIRHRDSIEPENRDEMSMLSSWTSKVVLESVAHFAMINDFEAVIKGLVKDERALGRCFGYTEIVAGTENLLGNSPKKTCSAWLQNIDTKEFELLRETSFFETKRKEPELKPIFEKLAADSTSLPPPGMFDSDNSKHSDIEISSLIDIPLWNNAGWTGVGYSWEEYSGKPPIMLILFTNKDAGMKIFEQWKHRIGDRDENDLLRISIITGVKKKNPAHYNVVLGSNWFLKPRKTLFMALSIRFLLLSVLRLNSFRSEISPRRVSDSLK